MNNESSSPYSGSGGKRRLLLSIGLLLSVAANAVISTTTGVLWLSVVLGLIALACAATLVYDRFGRNGAR